MAKNDECYTPQWVFDDLGLHFDLDVCSSYHDLIIVPAEHRYTVEDNSLEKEWFGRVWMNPPFSDITPFMDKWLDHQNGVCLVPLASNGKWMNRLWNSEAAWVYMRPNMKFVGASGNPVIMRWRVAVCAFGESNIEALKKTNWGKIR